MEKEDGYGGIKIYTGNVTCVIPHQQLKTVNDLLYKPPFNLYLDFTKALGMVFSTHLSRDTILMKQLPRRTPEVRSFEVLSNVPQKSLSKWSSWKKIDSRLLWH